MLISTNIQKARFNVYLVLSDGSLGIHNPVYVADLLNAAENFIYEELFIHDSGQLQIANFQ